MKNLVEKFTKNFTDKAILGSAKKWFEQQKVMPKHTGISIFSAEINVDNQIFETELKLENKSVYGDCSCGARKFCSHILATLFLAEKFGDFSLALKRNVKSEIIFTKTKSKDCCPSGKIYEIYTEIENKIWQQKKNQTFEGFPKEIQENSLLNFSLKTPKFDGNFSPENNFFIDVILNLDESKNRQKTMIQFFYKNQLTENKFSKRLPFFNLHDLPWCYSLLYNLQQFYLKPKSLAKSLIETQMNVYQIPLNLTPILLPKFLEKNALFWRKNAHETTICQMQISPERWQFYLDFSEVQNGFLIKFFLKSRNSKIELKNCEWVCQNGFAITEKNFITFENYKCDKLIEKFTEKDSIFLSFSEMQRWLQGLYLNSNYPSENLPIKFRQKEVHDFQPECRLFVRTAKYKFRGKEQLHCELSFNYDGSYIKDFSQQQKILSENQQKIYFRNFQLENYWQNYLKNLNFRFNYKNGFEEFGWKILPSKLDEVVRDLVQKNWIITAEGKTYRQPQNMKMRIKSSGTEWFNLELDLPDNLLTFPELFKSVKNKKDTVRLSDGSIGILPLDWLKKFTVLCELGIEKDNVLQFRKSQLLILTDFLKDFGEIDYSEEFQKITQNFAKFSTIKSIELSPTFCGKLRDYQQKGLNWFHFLQEFGLGGILADDMGLGKTVQILALLENRRLQNAPPSLIVVPRSLIFNWENEINKFTPKMKVFINSGTNRLKNIDNLHQYNIILTTYGTLIRDVTGFKNEFDYCILDESQLIKNRETQNAKAAIAVKSKFRLCMSGTPIENSFTDLLSQFEFLNPAIIQQNNIFQKITKISAELTTQMINSVKKSLQPFILRRIKKDVAKELPEKIEQEVFCEMPSWQKEKYDELQEYYRQQFLLSNEKKTNVDILTALLRLRQMACHPGLLNENLQNYPSGKFAYLFEQIKIILAENHKVLIFSQFKSLLKIIAAKLKKEKEIFGDFAYIDGETKNRENEVKKFQEDPNYKIFLISLKAGSTGLNLTTAEYVFLLDPWWNPASEAQAIDRAYRIGQKNIVFAYKLISKNTIEEKILELKKQKQSLANTIVNSTILDIEKLSRNDLEFLLN